MLLNEQQLTDKIAQIYKEEQFKILQEKWVELTGPERIFVIEFFKEFYPKKVHLINEDKWYNTLGDIAGIFDPTGLIDAINAVSYFKQGDTLYGAMSLISAVPYIGDVIGKPIVLGLKAGGTMAKELRLAKDATQWGRLGAKYPIIGRLLDSVKSWGDSILKIIEKVPGGKRFTKRLGEWVDMIKNVPTKRTISKGADGLSRASAPKLVNSEFRMFRDFGMKPEYGWFMRAWKKGGFFGKNRQLSKLLSRTKFWLGFLDYMGVANFVGPDETIQKMGQEQFDKKMEQYMNTPEAQQNWTSEMGNIPSGEAPPPPPPSESSSSVSKGSDPINSIINTLLGGALKTAI